MLNDKDTEIKTKFDDLSVDELKEALKNTFFYSGEFSDADMEEMDQIMAVLDRKEPLDPLYSAEESLKQFKEAYGEELSSLGVRNTEEVMQEISAADSDAVCSGSKVKAVRPVRRRRLLRTAVVAASVIMVLVAIAATASAMGYNLFGWVPKWNKDVLSFESENRKEDPDEDDLQGIPEVLASLGIDESLYPTWIPEDLVWTDLVVDKDPLFLLEAFNNDNRFLSITISPTSGSETAMYQKGDNSPIEHFAGGVTHLIFQNASELTAVWYTEDYTVTIIGNITLDEMRKSIDSVYEVKK